MKKLLAALMLGMIFTGSTAINSETTFINNSIHASAAETLSKPVLKGETRTSSTADLSVTKVEGAYSYKIYRSESMSGSYKYIGYTRTGNYKDSNLNASKGYYYKSKAYVVKKSNQIHSQYSNVVTVQSALKKTYNLKADTAKNGDVALKWSPVSSASGYKVYRASSKQGTLQYIGYSDNPAYTDNSAVLGRDYYYRVRAFKKAGGLKYNGVFSDKVSSKNASASTNSNDFANQVVELVNQERAKAGLSKLKTATNLVKAADHRAVEIVTSFSHTRPDGTSFSTVLKEFGVSYRATGENIAWGQRSAKEVMNSWMNSPGHRANILGNQFGKIGVGCYSKGGTLYWTQLFTN